MVQELLQEFYRNTKKRPERIIVYRDGVSEGQFDAVVREELPQVRLLCCCLLITAVTRTTLHAVESTMEYRSACTCLLCISLFSVLLLSFRYRVQCPERHLCSACG